MTADRVDPWDEPEPRLVSRVLENRWFGAGFALLVILTSWQIVAERSDSVIEVPSPTSTVAAMWEMGETGEIWTALGSSMTVLVAAGIPAIVIGVGLGLVIGSVRHLDIAVSPYIFSMYTTPFIALIPLFVLLFGIGFQAKVAIVFTLMIIAVLINTIAGVRSVDPRLVEVGRSLRMSRWSMLAEVRFPAALPFVIAGTRYAIGRGLIGVVVAEFDTALGGLGAEIFRHSQMLDLSKALVPAVMLGLIGLLLNDLLRRWEERFQRWRHLAD